MIINRYYLKCNGITAEHISCMPEKEASAKYRALFSVQNFDRVGVEKRILN